MNPVNLKVGNRIVKSTDVTYNDLVELYSQFVSKNGRVPIAKECTADNNLPQTRIINRVLRSVGITYKDFIGVFGKKCHARANSDDYELFICKFKEYSNELGRPLTSAELTSETYNLPSVKWFVKFCPDKSVKNYRDFVTWCGYEPCKKIWTKEEVAAVLRNFEAEHDRNVVKEDVTTSTMGFSTIVIDRLFGSFGAMREECGLRDVEPRYSMTSQYYVNHLAEVVLNYKKETGNPYISWSDIESGLYHPVKHEHKTYSNNFKKVGIDVFAYVKSLGCLMNQNGYSDSYIFDDGELVRSSYEYNFTKYLRDNGLVYNKDYFRDVRYKTFSDEHGKIDCDYVIEVSQHPVYIEIAGVLNSSYDGKWETVDLQSNRHTGYRNTLLKKKCVLDSIGAEYYFLFKDDMRNSSYKNLIDKLAARRSA